MKTPCDTGETDGNWAQIRNNLWQLPSDRSEFTMTNFVAVKHFWLKKYN